MSRARDIANFGDGIATADIDDGAVTAGKINSTLDLSGKTVTLPSGVGGKVLQVQPAMATWSGNYDIGASWASPPGMNVLITPSSTSSKIMYFMRAASHVQGNSGANMDARGRVERIIGGGSPTVINAADRYNGFHNWSGSDGWRANFVLAMGVDSPNTTSEVEYKFYAMRSGGNFYRFHDTSGADNNISVFALEIAG